MSYKSRPVNHEVSSVPHRRDSSSEEITQFLEYVEKEKKHAANLVKQQKTMKDEGLKPQLKPETPEETAAHEEKMSEGLAQLRRFAGVGNSIDSNQLGLESKAIAARGNEVSADQARESFLQRKMEQLGQEAGDFQAKLVKELADMKAQVRNDSKEAMLEMFKKLNHHPGDNSRDDDQDKKKSTDDLADDQDTKSSKPQKKVDNSSGNVYDQLSYAQSIDYYNEPSESSDKVSGSRPSKKANGPSGTVGEAIEQKITKSEKGGNWGKKL